MNPDPTTAREIERLEVHRGRERAGELSRTGSGARFTYDPSYVAAHRDVESRAIAFRMSVRAEAYEVRGVNLHPFFAGLLPEGLRLRALVRGVKTSEDDLFTLLAAVGADTVGDVRVEVPGAEPVEKTPLVDTQNLKEHDFAELLAQSLDWSQGGDAVTVAGIQPKVSAAMISFPLRARSKRRAYILKLSPPEYPGLVENEAFFMKMARSIRLKTAAVELVDDRRGNPGLLVERFDRVPGGPSGSGPLLELHQEDACQLLDRYPAEKYRLGLREIADSLEVCSAPLVERLRLLQLQALSYLVVNGDLHAKNISVQTVSGQVCLTPIYDLLSTLPYGDAKLALKLEGRDENLRREQFIAFGERLGIRRPATEKMLDALVKGIGPWVRRLPEIGLGEKETRHLERVMNERLGQLAG